MEGIQRTRYGYIINRFIVNRDDYLWEHTMKRVNDFEAKSKSREDFVKKMVTRLKRIKNLDKVYYTIAVLVEKGYHDVAEIYDSRLVLENLSFEESFLFD